MFFKNLKVHFIGIGGIGVSGLARFLKAQGAIVSGSDIAETSITKGLRSEGITINIPHDSGAINGKDLIIHSAIIKDSNIEIMESKRQNKKIFSRKDALLELLKERQVLSICAAHGKSSTSAILSAILPKAGAIIGAISKEFNSNVRVSKDKLLIFEADESDKSFLNSNPYKSIVLNAEAEHLESYGGDFNALKNAYLEFIKLAKVAVLNVGCPVVLELYKRLIKEMPYLDSKVSLDSNVALDSVESSENNNVIESRLTKIDTFNPKNDIKNIHYTLQDSKPYTAFSFRDFGEFKIFGIGEHNAQNAGIAILSALEFQNIESIRKNILNFKGIKKRFDILCDLDSKSPCIIDDYAHHPTEIRATLSAAKIYADLLFKEKVREFESLDSTESTFKKHLNKSQDSIKITAIFQPHKYSRLRDNLDAFCACFVGCDELVILPVWAAGEEKIDFDFAKLFKAYNPIFAVRVKRVDSKKGASLHLLDSNDKLIKILDFGIILGLGAGDITYQLRGEK
ncbi:UDP-N-acetylmuramate--L-alanine ligase [Helicobacter saguini]|uniref:UDP-N-acetylmuramate--L-alanine ligase n=1 Tax=Helicobacter saguini TaxID=1548018 RepID=A0A347VP45_9HELI|nr:Mur ligase domain-containing protein [Helicobacter saguini]MWV61517.1 UDP-N-acetylmuramate--L-alanine ligase [Helicobacter saguini]MWV67813.1 UDP-N-acetylmuramate--L-alanine ligase [Helicobacter saguini]MWV70719.1 UDP-N-acetylmuramate--L-alanine ligase [Helicobacter saguini]MWV72622.1 UDP-N-acetylmuramate--L-alanine ligase [Helicobacter saguini]TLD94569.1 UDP-N-acetylmuramate--L-alanine ligase [Helicobacter saguini]